MKIPERRNVITEKEMIYPVVKNMLTLYVFGISTYY